MVCEDGGIPVFPDGIEAFLFEDFCDLVNWALVVDFELSGGSITGFLFVFEFDSTPFDGEMKIIGPCSSVSAGIGLRARRDMGDTEGE